MKTVLKEWAKDPISCVMLVTWFITSTMCTTLGSWMIAHLSTTVSAPENLNHNLAVLVLIGVLMLIADSVREYAELAADHCVTSSYNRFTDKMLDSEYSMFTKYSCAKINIISQFTWKLGKVGSLTLTLINSIVRILITLASMYLIGGKVILPVICIYILFAVFLKNAFVAYKKISKMTKKIQVKRDQEMENIINGFQLIKIHSTQNKHRDSIKDANNSIYKNRSKRCKIGISIVALFELLDHIGLFVILIVVVPMIVNGNIPSSAAMSLIMYVYNLDGPLNNILHLLDNILDELKLAKDYEELMGYKNRNPEGNMVLDRFEDRIEIKDLSFAYDSTDNVLKSINMSIPKGSHIGLCGTSGGGKSTLFKLLSKFYKPTDGSITVDGVDIWDITDRSYRQFIGYVTQETTIFPGTIRDNITYGIDNVSEYELIEACKKANIYDFILKSPGKFEADVGPNGIKLSGGLKQRIALARLFLSKAEIILLDEATSALDNENELLVQEALDKLKDRTTITIAHRLTTIQNCDIIYVLGDDHRIIEQGTHEELLKMNGKYAKLYNKTK